MFQQFTGKVNASGSGSVQVVHTNSATEWDIYQISVICGAPSAGCIVVININNCFLCATPQGSMDTATGPPNVVLGAKDDMEVLWSNAVVNDTILVNVWYNENPVGTTYVTTALTSGVALPR